MMLIIYITGFFISMVMYAEDGYSLLERLLQSLFWPILLPIMILIDLVDLLIEAFTS